METIYLGAGCFWCTEAVFKNLRGVISVSPGYIGGHVENPTYEQVCTGETGHVEVAKVEYNKNIISTEELLDVFFNTHDPTSVDRQGADVGSQYRSAIFYTEHKQKEIADKIIVDRNKLLPENKKIVTEVILVPNFYEAESYHHDYYRQNKDKMYCKLVIEPKLKRLVDQHGDLLKNKWFILLEIARLEIKL